MNNVNLTDITDTIKVVDMDYRAKTHKLKIANPHFLDAKFHELNMMKKGNNSIEFMNTISLYAFKDYVFCKKRVFFDEDFSNIKLINRNLTCDSLSEKNETSTMINCGILRDYYKICVDKSVMLFNSRQINNDLRLLKDEDYCPLMDLEINFIDNPEFKNNNKVNKLLALVSYTRNNTVYSLKTNSTNLDPYWEPINSYDGLGFNQYLVSYRDNPKNLIMDVEEAITFNNYYDLENDTDKYNSTDFIYSDPKEITNINIGEKFGYRDSYTRIFDSQGLYSFYNSTNFMGQVDYTENDINYTSYLPFAMKSPDAKNYYSPKIQNETEEKINSVYAGLYEMQPFSTDCFNKVFEKNGLPDVFNYLNQININFLMEVFPTLIAWFCIVLFIQFWGFIKIRTSYLLDILNFRVKECDIKSEKITKYTFKVFMFLAFLIIFKGLALQGGRSISIISNAELLLEHNCFPENIAKNFKAIEKLSRLIDIKFSNVRMIFYFLIFTEILIILVYIKNDKNDFKPIDKDKMLIAKTVKIQ